MNPLALGLLIATDAAALGLAVRATGVRWWLRAAAVVVVLGAAFAVWAAASDTAGWPVSGGLPGDSRFVSCVVVEPTVDGPGRVYLWLIPLRAASDPLAGARAPSEPRAYSEPFSPQLEAACQAAEKAVAAGRAVGIRVHGGQRRRHGGGQQLLARGKFMPYVLPAETPPRKGN